MSTNSPEYVDLDDAALVVDDAPAGADPPRDPSSPPPFACEFVTGPAGTGKTFEMRRRIDEDPSWGVLAATTGIAAVNLDTQTINSLLGYFDTASLEDRFVSGNLERKLADLVLNGARNLVIDEVSMLDGRQLDLIYRAACQAAERKGLQGKTLGLVVTGDFCQLPPVKAPFAFTAECWPHFERSTTRLEKVWRQSDPRFLEALNLIRGGKGFEGAELLRTCGVTFAGGADVDFAGTTIVGTNKEVDNYNFTRLNKLPGVYIDVRSFRWGRQKGEWTSQIPEVLRLKMDAYVMILTNNPPSFNFVNGDCGYVRSTTAGVFEIELVRTGEHVTIQPIVRNYEVRNAPDGWQWDGCWRVSKASDPEIKSMLAERGVTPTMYWTYAHTGEEVKTSPPWGTPYYDEVRDRFVIGAIRYVPLRPAYASSVHKSQGLSLDRVQLDVRGRFMGTPSMVYVGLSRARTPEGLRIVGTPTMLAQRVNVDPQVARWL